jgi:hypothetical protein
MNTSTWRCYLDDECRDDALRIARSIANQLRDPARLSEVVALAHEQSPMADATEWLATSLGGGLGLVLLFGHLDRCFPQEGWYRDAHRHLEAAARRLETFSSPPLGLFEGMSGVGFSAAYLARDTGRYGRLLESLDEGVSRRARDLAREMLARRGGFHIADFDLVSGLTGAVVHLLGRRGNPRTAEALREALAALVSISSCHDGVPAWHTPAALVRDDVSSLKSEHTGGYVDCGLAHGCPGPLTAMSMACAAGVDVPGLRDGISRLAHWLLRHRHDDAWGLNWPSAIPLTLDADGAPLPLEPSLTLGGIPARTGWCYGAPGVARALWEAGNALSDPQFRDVAVEAMRATLRRPASERRLDSPTVCHGVAGYLQCMLRFAHATQLPEFIAEARELTAQLLAMREPAAPLGYRAVEMHGVRVDQPGLIDGASGVMGALLSAAMPVEPAWDRALLLS